MMQSHPQNQELQGIACGVIGILCAGKDAQRGNRSVAAAKVHGGNGWRWGFRLDVNWMATKKDMCIVLFLDEFMPKIYPTKNRTLICFFENKPQGWCVGSVSCCHHCAFGSPTATMGRGCSRQHLRLGCGHRTRSSSRGVRKSGWQGFSHVVSVLFLDS